MNPFWWWYYTLIGYAAVWLPAPLAVGTLFMIARSRPVSLDPPDVGEFDSTAALRDCVAQAKDPAPEGSRALAWAGSLGAASPLVGATLGFAVAAIPIALFGSGANSVVAMSPDADLSALLNLIALLVASVVLGMLTLTAALMFITIRVASRLAAPPKRLAVAADRHSVSRARIGAMATLVLTAPYLLLWLYLVATEGSWALFRGGLWS